MKWFILLVGILFLCFVVALVLGIVGGGMGGPTSSLSHERLPEGELKDEDFDQLVFDVALRGYRMSQVDGVVDRLRRELRDKDDQIAALRGDAPTPRPEAMDAAALEAGAGAGVEARSQSRAADDAQEPDEPDQPEDAGAAERHGTRQA